MVPHMSNTSLARALRQRRTWPQKLVWRWLRDRRFSAYKFRREHPVDNYFVDCFCEEARLSIELDGFQHGLTEQRALAEERTKFLQTKGIRELRFWNHQLRRE